MSPGEADDHDGWWGGRMLGGYGGIVIMGSVS
jgi:hypothetical protein